MQITSPHISPHLGDEWWYLNWFNWLNTCFEYSLYSSINLPSCCLHLILRWVCRENNEKYSFADHNWWDLCLVADAKTIRWYQSVLPPLWVFAFFRHKYRPRKQLGRASYHLIFLCSQTMATKLKTTRNGEIFLFSLWTLLDIPVVRWELRWIRAKMWKEMMWTLGYQWQWKISCLNVLTV